MNLIEIEKRTRIVSNLEKIIYNAGKLLLQKQNEVQIKNVPEKDFVTEADYWSENFILNNLNKLFPGIPFYSEEKGGMADRNAEYLWVIDPLDGTVNYARQDFNWGISVALLHQGITEIGLVYLPKLRKIFITDKSRNSLKPSLWVSKRNLPKDRVTPLLDWSKNKTLDRFTSELFLHLKKQIFYPQVRLCATASLMAVAQGQCEVYIHPGPEPFDIAAACLIVELAGGKVTDFAGNPWHPFSPNIIASNGLVHDKILNIVKCDSKKLSE